MSGLPAVQAVVVDALHVDGTSAGFGQPGSADWDTYIVPNYQGNSLLVAGSAEPSGGVCWKSSPANTAGKDVFYFKTMTGVGKATFNDAATPPAVSWSDVSRRTVPEVHHAFADPILHTDEVTCRTWAGHMQFPNPCTNDMAFRDETPATATPPGNPVDGWTTIPVLCQPSLADHQTVGSGPYSRDVDLPAATPYPRIVYYCAQYPTINGCTESYDGGLTWIVQQPGTAPTQPLSCAGLFGHLKVSEAEGYAVIPHSSCLSNAGIQLSKNNGLTWAASDIPGIPPNGRFDPGVAWSRTAKAGGNSHLYFAVGMAGGLYASMSPDFGASWQNTGLITSGYRGPSGERITRAEFANVEAGDWNRAAVSFLATTDTTGADAWVCTAPKEVVWHLYVARTFDAGATWKVERASGDPVQVGGIWPGGGESPCRNLLDFNDLDMGSDGRLYVSYADGCTAARACFEGASPSTSNSDRGALTRQSTGCGLLAAYDVPGSDCVNGSGTDVDSGPKVTITSPADGATITPGNVTVSGTVNRAAPLDGAGAGGASAALPDLRAASLVHPTGGQDLYLKSKTVPVGNVDRANAGAELVAAAPTATTPSVSVHATSTSQPESVAEASWTYKGPVDLADATITVTWYGSLPGAPTALEEWQADIYIGAAQIASTASVHPFATKTFPASPSTPRVITLEHVSGSGTNLVLMLRAVSATGTAVVLYGSTSHPSGIRVVENGQANPAPTAAFGCTVANLTVTCDGSASTDDESIASYAWSFGGGATGTGVVASHTYASAGSKTITLTVTDNEGATDAESRAYTVTAPPPPTETVQLIVDGALKGVVVVDSAAPGDHAWSRVLDLRGLGSGSHTVVARWLDTEGTELDSDEVTVQVGSTAGPTVSITSPTDGATVAPGSLQVAGTLDRPLGGGASASPLQVPGLRAANLVHPASPQSLYLHTTTVPVGNVDGAAGGADMVADPPTSDTPSVSVHAVTLAASTAPGGAAWTYRGPVDLTNATVTVTWYGALGPWATTSENWEANLFIGAAQIASFNVPHSVASGTFPIGASAKTLTFTGVTGAGTNMALMLRSFSAAVPAVVLFGSTDFPSGITVSEGSGTANLPPTAAFSCTAADLTLSCNGGASSDPDGSIASYAWNFGDGGTGTGVAASHTYATAGSKTVTLTVTDDDGATDGESQSHTVTAPANAAPTATLGASPTSGTAPLAVTFTLGASDSDGTIASYSLAFGDGSPAQSGSGTPPASVQHTYTAGSYTAVLTVTDDDGAQDTAEAAITATQPANSLPTATLGASPTSGTAPLAVTFTLGASDSDGTIADWSLAFGDGSAAQSGSGSPPASVQHTYTAVGTFTATLTVHDDDGATGTASAQVTATATPNDPPTAAFSCTVSDLSVSCNGGASSDPDGSIASYAWTFGDGGTGSGPTASHTYATPGSKTVTLTVTDDDGATDGESHSYTVTAPASEKVEVLVDGVLETSVDVDAAAPGSHPWSATVDLSGLTGSHTLTARWLDADGTELDSDEVTVQVGTTTSTSTSTSTSSSATTGTNTGTAGGSVNNVAPVVDTLAAAPSVATLGVDGQVALNGTAHDDNGHEDVASVTVKVTAPGGSSGFLVPSRADDAADVTALSFAATHAIASDAETGTYQVDTFATDADGAQSPVVSVTFTVLPPTTSSVDVGYTGGGDRLDFGSFNPGAHNVTSVNAFSVANNLGHDAHFLFDMSNFSCTRGGVPVMGNANVILGSVDGNGVFTPIATKGYTQSTVDFGTISDGTRLFVKMELHSIPKGIAGTCSASFGLYHT